MQLFLSISVDSAGAPAAGEKPVLRIATFSVRLSLTNKYYFFDLCGRCSLHGGLFVLWGLHLWAWLLRTNTRTLRLDLCDLKGHLYFTTSKGKTHWPYGNKQVKILPIWQKKTLRITRLWHRRRFLINEYEFERNCRRSFLSLRRSACQSVLSTRQMTSFLYALIS